MQCVIGIVVLENIVNAYAQRFQYRNPDWTALERVDGTVACVVKSGASAPLGWERRDFGSYCVYTREESA